MIEIKNEFKTIQFAFFFTNYDAKDTRVYRFLLPKLLASHSDKFTSKSFMQKHLEDLYGARIYTRSELHANLNVMSFVFTIVDPKIVNDDELIHKSIDLLNDMFVDRNYFNETIFNEEKRLLIEQWETLKDHKRAYANVEFGKAFFESDLAAYPLSGTIQDIKKLTLADLTNYYKNQFFKDDIKVIINGHYEAYIAYIDQHLKIKTQNQHLKPAFKFRSLKPLQKLEEETQMNQAILKLGYLLPIYRFDSLYEAALCADIMLGGYPESRLFKEIREKQGLCYDISSNYDFYKGVITISSGVAKNQKDYALEEIIHTVESFKQQEITESELLYAKAYLIHQIKSSLDSQSYMTKRAYFKRLFNDHTTTDQRIESIKKVTLENIKNVVRMIELDTTYVLYGGM